MDANALGRLRAGSSNARRGRILFMDVGITNPVCLAPDGIGVVDFVDELHRAQGVLRCAAGHRPVVENAVGERDNFRPSGSRPPFARGPQDRKGPGDGPPREQKFGRPSGSKPPFARGRQDRGERESSRASGPRPTEARSPQDRKGRPPVGKSPKLERDPQKTLERVLSKAGLGSRTDARSWIGAGRVKVNGKLIQTPDHWVDVARDKVTLDGNSVSVSPAGLFAFGFTYDQTKHVVERVRQAMKLEPPAQRRRTVERLDRHEVEVLIHAAYKRSSTYGLMVKTLKSQDFVDIQNRV